jgi:hypothetical protein
LQFLSGSADEGLAEWFSFQRFSDAQVASEHAL